MVTPRALRSATRSTELTIDMPVLSKIKTFHIGLSSFIIGSASGKRPSSFLSLFVEAGLCRSSMRYNAAICLSRSETYVWLAMMLWELVLVAPAIRSDLLHITKLENREGGCGQWTLIRQAANLGMTVRRFQALRSGSRGHGNSSSYERYTLQ
jgi:hypothetical protein